MPYPMPKISDLAPADSNDDGFGPASNANNNTYAPGNYWRCVRGPANNADSGVLVPGPVYLAYDLSGIPDLGQIIAHWDASGANGPYNSVLAGTLAANIPTIYTIDLNAAPGGSYPSNGWVTKVSVNDTATPYHSRQFLIDMSGYKWVRMNVSAIAGSGDGVNAQCAIDLDIHRAPQGATDSWLFTGDSITQQAFLYSESGGLSNILPKQINSAFPGFFPVWESAGMQFWTSTDGEAHLDTWLPLFPGKNLGLNWGTNDAEFAGINLTNFPAKMQSMINKARNAGITLVVIPHIPWGRTTNIQANGPAINSQIDALVTSNSDICVAGPDLWTAFFNNQSYIEALVDGGIHPTLPDGYNFYRGLWSAWATSIYLKLLSTSAQSRFKPRMALNTSAQSQFKVRMNLTTSAQSRFKIQLVNVGPKIYQVTQVATETQPPRPFSTIQSQASIVDASGATQDAMNCSVTVTYPDGSTTRPTVYSLGNGIYETTYTTGGEGTIEELWMFTDGAGGQAEYQNDVVCRY